MTIAIDILLKSKCHCVVELAFDLTRFFFSCKRLINKCLTKVTICFIVKKQRLSLLIPDLLFLWLAKATEKYNVFTAFRLKCLLLHILCAKTFTSSENTNSSRSNCLSCFHKTFFSPFDKFTCPVEINCLFTEGTAP